MRSRGNKPKVSTDFEPGCHLCPFKAGSGKSNPLRCRGCIEKVVDQNLPRSARRGY